MKGTPEQISHFNKTVTELTDRLDDMTMTFDSKILAAVLLNRAASLLNAMYSTGVMPKEEVEGMVALTFERVTVKQNAAAIKITRIEPSKVAS